MIDEALYKDGLISITDKNIVFYHYYFPTGKKKCIKIDDIECISILKPTLLNGKWRIHGTGNFKVWFPQDNNRPSHDRIFLATLKTQWVNIGFTVEDGDTVEKILKSKNLIKESNTEHQL